MPMRRRLVRQTSASAAPPFTSHAATGLLATLDRRFWLVSVLATVGSLLLLGVPTAVVPNPFFVRMTPTGALDVAFWLVSSPLMGLTVATYLAKPGSFQADAHAGGGSGRVSLAGIGAFLAIGCPVCNKVVIALLGVSGALSIFAPLQPFIGGTSVAILAVTLAYRLRQRVQGCLRCVPTTAGA